MATASDNLLNASYILAIKTDGVSIQICVLLNMHALPLLHFWYNANICQYWEFGFKCDYGIQNPQKDLYPKKKKGCHFGSYGCCNKLSVTRWLETPEIYSLIFLTARSRKLVLLGQNIQSCLPFLLTGCHPVLASAASVLLASLVCGQITTISASMASLPSLLFVFNLPLHFFYKGTYACV